MRVGKRGSHLSVHAIAGTHVVYLAFDVDDEARRGLLGFAIERTDRDSGEREWLPNYIHFVENDRPGGPRTTRDNPVQTFLWGDFEVEPRQRLGYRVQALYGRPGALEPGDELELEIDSEAADDGRHGVYFNRGVPASQAYARRFNNESPLGNPAAEAFMSRGLLEALIAFIGRAARPGRGIRGALYEFWFEPVLRALGGAAEGGGDIQLVVAMPEQEDGDLEDPTPRNRAAIEAAGIGALVRPRKHSSGIAHNKFLVLMEGDEPVEVWTGSTNITEGALFGHSNVGHSCADRQVAASFLRYWEELARDITSRELRPFIEEESPLPSPGSAASVSEVLSPRGGLDALEWYAGRMREARHSAFFTAPFGFSETFEDVLRLDLDLPRYAILNRPERAEDFALREADAETELVAGAYVGKGGWRQFVEEQPSKLNQWAPYIHTKFLLVDPLSEEPLVVTGSANFSEGSTKTNDENMLVVRGDGRVADIYLTEFLRVFLHLRFRARIARVKDAPVPQPEDPDVPTDRHLAADDGWTDPYWTDGDPKRRERLLFRAP